MVGGAAESTFSDDANPRSRGRGLTSPGSWLPARLGIQLWSVFDQRVGAMRIVAVVYIAILWFYQRYEDATLLMRLGDMPSGAEITPCMGICGEQ